MGVGWGGVRDNRRWQSRVVERRYSAVMSQGPDELLLRVVCSTLSHSEMQGGGQEKKRSSQAERCHYTAGLASEARRC